MRRRFSASEEADYLTDIKALTIYESPKRRKNLNSEEKEVEGNKNDKINDNDDDDDDERRTSLTQNSQKTFETFFPRLTLV